MTLGAGSEAVTLVAGSLVAVSSPTGDISPGADLGLFFGDTRFVSRWQLRVDGSPLQRLAVATESASAAHFTSRARPPAGQPDSPLLVSRRRELARGLRDVIEVHNLGPTPLTCVLAFDLDVDFARLVDIKERRRPRRRPRLVTLGPSSISHSWSSRLAARRLEAHFPSDAVVSPTGALLEVAIAPNASYQTSVAFEFGVDGRSIGIDDLGARDRGRQREQRWQAALPRIYASDETLAATFEHSVDDLRALHLFDTAQSDDATFAAGAPWYTTLFGRDALFTSLMTLAFDPRSALTTLRVLARFQGEGVDARTGEEPGKILHHLRGSFAALADADRSAAEYGSIDATPLFVILLGALQRWGLDPDVLHELLPVADRALRWIEEFGDRDGDGFVEYPAAPRGLVNQGWKDSVDSTSFADGTLAAAPIALCEVQGYVFSAYLARAELARALGDAGTFDRYRDRAAQLKRAFNERFWLPEQGYYALGLDAEKRPIDAITSNVGHCLWSGIVDAARAPAVAAQLRSPAMFSGWGVRTLSSAMAAFNPASYHNGSVWPHDSAICAAGLARYGFIEDAHALTRGLLAAAAAFGGRLPELFCGFARDEFPRPVPYPNACTPQAWAAATPFFLLTSTLLRLDPAIADGEILCSPCVPDELGALLIEHLAVGNAHLSIDTAAGTTALTGPSPTLAVTAATRAVEAR